MFPLPFVFIFFAFFQPLQAEETESHIINETDLAKPLDQKKRSPKKENSNWSLVLSNELSLGWTIPHSTQYESLKAGWIFHPFMGVHFQTHQWATSLQGGWMNAQLNGNPKGLAHPQWGPDRSYVNTQLGTARLQGLYLLTPQHQLGGHLQVLYGTDTSFAPWSVDESMNVLLGLNYQYAQNLTNEISWFAGGTLQTDVSFVNRNFFNISLALGLLIHIPQSPSHQIQYQTIIEYQKETTFVYSFNAKFIHFDFQSSSPTSKSKKLIQALGVFLKENLDIWESIQIEGHTDLQGNADYNQKLSEDRADAIKKLLVQEGVPEKRIRTKGWGLARPIVEGTRAEDHAKNRRVEMRFQGIKDSQKMNEKIDEIKAQHEFSKTP